jgi:transcriptional regulator with XRE-family HTH domain
MADASWFPGRLKELREQAGLTQQQLAERAGFTKAGVAQWESGRRVPAWPHVLALANALSVSSEAFNQEPAGRPPQGRGRPRKAQPPGQVQPKRPRGRPRKDSGPGKKSPRRSQRKGKG